MPARRVIVHRAAVPRHELLSAAPGCPTNVEPFIVNPREAPPGCRPDLELTRGTTPVRRRGRTSLVIPDDFLTII